MINKIKRCRTCNNSMMMMCAFVSCSIVPVAGSLLFRSLAHISHTYLDIYFGGHTHQSGGRINGSTFHKRHKW